MVLVQPIGDILTLRPNCEPTQNKSVSGFGRTDDRDGLIRMCLRTFTGHFIKHLVRTVPDTFLRNGIIRVCRLLYLAVCTTKLSSFVGHPTIQYAQMDLRRMLYQHARVHSALPNRGMGPYCSMHAREHAKAGRVHESTRVTSTPPLY